MMYKDLYTDIQFSRKLAATFFLRNMKGPLFSRKLIAEVVLWIKKAHLFSHKLTANFVLGRKGHLFSL